MTILDVLFTPLDSCRDANQKLQDTNDGLRSVVDMRDLHSPRTSAGSDHGFGTGGGERIGLLSPEMLGSASDIELADRLYQHAGKRHRRRRYLYD